MTNLDTIIGVPDRAVSVRLDVEANDALEQLMRSGMTQSDAIRRALVEASARRRPHRSLAAEAMWLMADEDDRRESLAVAEFMESLRAPWPDDAER